MGNKFFSKEFKLKSTDKTIKVEKTLYFHSEKEAELIQNYKVYDTKSGKLLGERSFNETLTVDSSVRQLRRKTLKSASPYLNEYNFELFLSGI